MTTKQDKAFTVKIVETEERWPYQLSPLDVIEVRMALMQRRDELEKLKKKMLSAGLSTADIREHLVRIEGTDEEPGLLGRLSDQLEAFDAASRAQEEMPL